MSITKYGTDVEGDIWWAIDGDTNRLICANTYEAAMLFVREGHYGGDLAYVTENYGPIKEI